MINFGGLLYLHMKNALIKNINLYNMPIPGSRNSAVQLHIQYFSLQLYLSCLS